MFGINAAPEIYQREISTLIAGIPGVASLADDVIVHGETKEVHDRSAGSNGRGRTNSECEEVCVWST